MIRIIIEFLYCKFSYFGNFEIQEYPNFRSLEISIFEIFAFWNINSGCFKYTNVGFSNLELCSIGIQRFQNFLIENYKNDSHRSTVELNINLQLNSNVHSYAPLNLRTYLFIFTKYFQNARTTATNVAGLSRAMVEKPTTKIAPTAGIVRWKNASAATA